MNLRNWQAEAFPRVMDNLDRRIVVRAVMGAGKSILLSHVAKHVEGTVLVTTPTVKLVEQLAETLAWWTGEEIGRLYTREKSQRRITVACNDSMAAYEGRPDLWIADECHRTECDQVKAAVEAMEPTRRVGFTATPWRADDKERLSLFDELVYDYGPGQAIRDGVVVKPRIVHWTDAGEDDLDEICVTLIKGAEGPGIVNARHIDDAESFAGMLCESGVRARAVHSRQSATDQKGLILSLKEGGLACLVHVNMLAEGVDLPWLRWLCCRRPVGSRVRFAQEVGRVLRAHPGKTEAVVYDPLDLFNVLGLDYEAVLACDLEERDETTVAGLKLADLLGEVAQDPGPKDDHGIPIRVIEPVASYLRRMRLELQTMGLVDMKVKATRWRRDPPSFSQLGFLRGLDGLVLRAPEPHQSALSAAWFAAPALTKGDVSDLISILLTCKTGWPLSAEASAA